MKPVNGYLMLIESDKAPKGLYIPGSGSVYFVKATSDDRFKEGDIVLSDKIKRLGDYIFVNANDVIGAQSA